GTSPQLGAMRPVIGDEVEATAGRGQASREREVARDTIVVRVDVLEQSGARGAAVALPQLAAVDAVVRREVEHAVEHSQRLRLRTGREGGAGVRDWTGVGHRGGVDVLDEPGAGRGAVALP